MAEYRNYLAVDLGAESGRAIVGSLNEDRLRLHETYRFSNGPVRLPDGFHWDVLRLWSEIKSGISASSLMFEKKLDGIGLDAWGVDFGLLDKNSALISNPYHYRDGRTDGMLAEAFRCMSRADIFKHTGIQFMQINTLYQLLAMVLEKSPMLEIARSLVTIPDLFNFWLSGQIVNEFTNATTTQCFDPSKREWALPVLEALDIPAHLFRSVTQPGVLLGNLLASVAEETGVSLIPVVVPACHDTGSAVVAVPAQKKDFAWISSGTWSIMGAEAAQPSIGEKALEYNFTNEGGVFGTWRLSKNIMGLWLVQECRRSWQHQGEDLSYDDVTRLAAQSPPFLAVIDPDAPRFLHPGDMPDTICQYCRETKQPVPQTKGQLVRIALEGIALKYRWVLERLEELTRRQLDPIHIIGGGVKNRLLNQFAADSTGRRVVTGPVEATAIGNILMQAVGLGHLAGLGEARRVVQASFPLETYQSGNRDGWDEAYSKLLSLMNS